MASIYVRLPHYIASWLRNMDESTPLTKADAIRLDSGDSLVTHLQMHLMPNLSNSVNMNCFSERQWQAMRQGKVIAYHKDSFVMDISRSARSPLTLSEIYQLCDREDLVRYDTETGEPMTDEEYTEEYVAFRLPNTIIVDGREVKVQSDFFLRDSQSFITELRSRFRKALTRFVAVDREIVHSAGLRRSKMESLDRFMLRYDIRTGDREREQLKKLLTRSAQAAALSLDADEDHGRWSREHLDDPRLEKREAKPYMRRVLCEDNGVIYPSVAAFQKEFGIRSHPQVINAIRNHWRVHGVYVRYAD